VFDIETTDLAAVGAGMILCVCIRPFSTQRTRTFRLDTYEYEQDDAFGFFQRQEKDLLAAVFEELDKYDLWVGHNIYNFDIPYLRSRAYQHGIAWNTRPLFYDTLKGFRNSGFLTRQNGFGKPCASMDMVADFLGLDQLKTKLYPAQHWQNIWGNKKQRLEALNMLVDHCERDVRMNAAMYPILLANDPKVVIKRM
jgi:DNA polymerase elongation subunit (family B)